MAYKIDYTPEPDNRATDVIVHSPVTNRISRPRRRELPSFLKTALIVLAAAMVFFTYEMVAPDGIRGSDLLGTFYARVITHETAAELEQKAELDAWAKQAEAANAQTLENYKAAAQIILQYQSAWSDRAKLYAQGQIDLQKALTGQRMDQVRSQQAGDQMIQTYAQIFGRLFNMVQPGSGNGALDYSRNLRNEMRAELDAAAQTGTLVTIDGWDTGLPSPVDFQRQLDALKPVPLPPRPTFGKSARH